jgi:TPR repeat protein
MLGTMYFDGKGVDQNYQKGIGLFTGPAEGGYPPVQKSLGFGYL